MPTFLRCARAIALQLQEMGVIPKDDPDPEGKVYYYAKTKKITTGRFGKDLITTSERLQRDIIKLIS